jgi:hypothetical protein
MAWIDVDSPAIERMKRIEFPLGAIDSDHGVAWEDREIVHRQVFWGTASSPKNAASETLKLVPPEVFVGMVLMSLATSITSSALDAMSKNCRAMGTPEHA